jgi:hypothetical protein
VGRAALEGLAGVEKVTRGFHHAREINRVTYDSSKITPQTMIEALQKAGTYVGIVDN